MMHSKVPAVKFCGLTRREDAREASRCGAAYLGVIFAGGPRLQTRDSALEVLGDRPLDVKRVGVFGAQPVEEIADIAAAVELDVVQLHADPRAQDVSRLRKRFTGEVWGVLRLAGPQLPEHACDLFRSADAVVLDAHVPGTLGGSGVALPWSALAGVLGELRRETRLVLAGGLHAGNVEAAIRALAPDVVDVSSGVERAPGIKDHTRLREFRDAVQAVQLQVEGAERND